MRLEWLDDIMAVAETGSLSEAAARRNLTQSAFSRRIQNIEDFVGVELFDRSRKPVQLHPGTANQLAEVERLSGELRRLAGDLRRGDPSAGNRIVLASQHALTTAMTPELVQKMRDRLPEVYIRLRSANLDECYGMLLSRRAEIALVYGIQGRERPVEADYIETRILGGDQLIPVFASAMIDRLNSAFQGGTLPIIAYPSEVFLGQIMEQDILPRVHRMARVEPKVETALTLAASELALGGIGVAWVPRSLVQTSLEDGRLTDLSKTLGARSVEVTALRLTGGAGKACEGVWDHLSTLRV